MHILLFFTTLKKQEHVIYKRIPTYIRICLYKLDNHAKMSSLYNYIYWANPAVKTWPTQSGTFMRMRRMFLRNRNSSSTVVFPLSSSEKEGIPALICQTKFTCSHWLIASKLSAPCNGVYKEWASSLAPAKKPVTPLNANTFVLSCVLKIIIIIITKEKKRKMGGQCNVTQLKYSK